MNRPKILYVDDENINLLLLEANLKKKYDVITADCGKSGLEILKNDEDIKVVISDMKMPNMNGLEFIKQAHERFSQVVYYVMTGFEITDEIQEALSSGLIRRYFRKPFNMNDISMEMEHVLKGEDH